MPLHEDQREANRHALQALNTAAKLAGGDAAMDAIINPLTDPGAVAGLKTGISALAVHEDQKYALVRINKGVDASKVLGVYTDANIAAAAGDGTQDLRVLHKNAVDPVIPDAELTQQGGVLYGE